MPRKMMIPVVLVAALVFLGPACSKKKAGGAAAEAELEQEAQSIAEAAEQEPAKGWLEIKGAGVQGQEVRKAGTAEKVEVVSATRPVVALPPGTYDVVFGQSLWKGAVVEKDRTTTLVPGWVTVAHASLEGHPVVDAASGAVQGSVSSLEDSIALVPGRYVVMFGRLGWPVEVRPGETLVLRPGTIEVPYADIAGHRIFDRSGAQVAEVSSVRSAVPLPPGDYEIELGERRIPFTLREGDVLRFDKE